MHTNNGKCAACDSIFSRYPGFNIGLRSWFDSVQMTHPDLHCSEAGRGKLAQEKAFSNGTSKAHYGQSAHNVNMALDAFCLKDGKAVYDKAWFNIVIGKNLIPMINWYGQPGAEFYELPHLEIRDWRKLCHFVE